MSSHSNYLGAKKCCATNLAKTVIGPQGAQGAQGAVGPAGSGGGASGYFQVRLETNISGPPNFYPIPFDLKL